MNICNRLSAIPSDRIGIIRMERSKNMCAMGMRLNRRAIKSIAIFSRLWTCEYRLCEDWTLYRRISTSVSASSSSSSLSVRSILSKSLRCTCASLNQHLAKIMEWKHEYLHQSAMKEADWYCTFGRSPSPSHSPSTISLDLNFAITFNWISTTSISQQLQGKWV